MPRFQVRSPLKEDAFGRVERVDDELGRPVAVRRVACGGRAPGSRWIARVLMERERRALRAIDATGGMRGVPVLPDDATSGAIAALPSADGRMPRARDVLVRAWIEGAPLSAAEELPEDFFDELDCLVADLHARGVCHNDLHKEQNVIVGADGLPRVVDFQLASVHAPSARALATRAREDLRHVEKHRRRYTRWGRGPRGASEPTRGAGAELRRSWIALAWRRTGKPVYVFVTRVLLGTKDGEARRPSSGPWPRWTPPAQRENDERGRIGCERDPRG